MKERLQKILSARGVASRRRAEEMITAGFDLSLYTCTPGGADRVTVRCNIAAGI